MKMLCNVKLSPHRYKTPEGYLYCKDAIIARTGSQTYLKSEIYENCDDNDYIEINRSEKEVFDEKTMASFEKKPLTIEHPSVNVNPSNYKDLAVGHIENVRRGMFEGQPVMLADIIVNDAEAISLIESGEMVELSCGYDCDITDGPNPEQINIRGNHVALCEQGRAGIARIQDSWGAKPISDSVGKGTLIQEFGKQGKQYKIQKIVGNVIYARSILEDKLVLFKKDEENIEWATITKSELRDTLPSQLSLKFEKEIKEFVEKLGNIEDVKFEYTSGYIPREHKSWVIIIPYVGNWNELPAGPYDASPEDKALDKLKEEFTKAGYKAFIENNHGHLKVYEKKSLKDAEQNEACGLYVNGELIKDRSKAWELAEKLYREGKLLTFSEYWIDEFDYPHDTDMRGTLRRSLEDSEEKIKFEECDDCYRMSQEELDEAWEKINKDKSTDILGGNKDRKVKRFVNKEKRDEFVKSLPKEAEVSMDEFDYTLKDKDDEDEFKWLTYWEVYYWDKKDIQDSKKKAVIEMIDLREAYMDENDVQQEYIKNEYLVRTPEGRPLAQFKTLQEAEEYARKINEDEISLEDSTSEFVIVLSDGEWLDEFDRPTKELSKARKFKNKEAAEAYKKIYCKGSVQELKEVVNDSENWFSINLKKGAPADDFKQYLRDRGLYFEPSENGSMIHFEVKNADDDVEKEVRAIKEHYAKFLDSSDYSKRFYIQAIKALNEKLEKLEKDELLDSNQEDYQIQKTKMTETIKKQIEDYKAKLKEIDGN